jgi:hypothetical protein
MIEKELGKNFVRLHSNFLKWAEKTRDLSKAFKLFIPQFQRSRVGWISAGRNVEGGRHQKLSEPYRTIKRKKLGVKPILVASEDLINAIQGGAGWRQKVSPKELVMEIDLPYASVHQDGSRDGRTPQRNYFLTKDGTMNKMDYAQLIQAIEGQIQKETEAILGTK